MISIKKNDCPGARLEIIVVDNGSRDDSAAVARQLGAAVLECPGLSVAALRNRGTQVASGDILAFVDADHELDSAWVTAAVEVLNGTGAAAAGAPYQAPSPGTWVQSAYDALRTRGPGMREVDWLGSGNLAIRRAAFEQLGGFDTSLETCEDVDLC